MSLSGRARSRAGTLAAFAVYACEDIGDALAEVGLFHRFHVGSLGRLVDAARPECAPQAASDRTQRRADGRAAII